MSNNIEAPRFCNKVARIAATVAIAGSTAGILQESKGAYANGAQQASKNEVVNLIPRVSIPFIARDTTYPLNANNYFDRKNPNIQAAIIVPSDKEVVSSKDFPIQVATLDPDQDFTMKVSLDGNPIECQTQISAVFKTEYETNYYPKDCRIDSMTTSEGEHTLEVTGKNSDGQIVSVQSRFEAR